MAAKLPIKPLYEQESINDPEFATDVLKGLSHKNKYLSSKYFYDPKGSELFNQITRHRDYYLTNCELEILNSHKGELSQLLSNESFNLIELGPGEGIKARILIDQFLQDSREFTYFTIDISQKYLNQLVKQFHEDLPQLKLKAINSDFFKGLKWLSSHSKRRNIVLFLGSSIGNFDRESTLKFLHEIWQDLQDGDYFLVGFDLRKNIDVLIQAYNDSDGITREFNLNLLSRINRELNADFDRTAFNHFATYNVYSGAMESYLISSKEQNVSVKALNQSFHFHEFEPIHVEYSYKYLRSQIEEFALISGFEIVKNFSDSKGYFINSLWRIRK